MLGAYKLNKKEGFVRAGFFPVLLYGNDTMVEKEKEGSRLGCTD